ncbi:hypothetical protein CKA32_004806 [Geitlerinema sp. FC II]|nr:hypothetical protein CKA32_004806 [Geitlerinema sp. FC II]
MNKKTLNFYKIKIKELRVSTSKKSSALYKPILLLSIIDLLAQKYIRENKIYISDSLVETFSSYWNVLVQQNHYKGGLHYPFFHLKRDEFWHLKFKKEWDGLQPKTTNKLKQAVEYAYLDEELFELLQDSTSRQEIIDELISKWFMDEGRQNEEVLRIHDSLESSEFEELEILQPEQWSLKKSRVRKAFFRKSVIHVYDYSCALCRLKTTESLTQHIVEAAHIKPYAQFYDNHIFNGISFCKNHHWAFDRGLFYITDNYKIFVKDDFEENSPNARPLKDFQGERLMLPQNENYYPSLAALAWHRQNIFST